VGLLWLRHIGRPGGQPVLSVTNFLVLAFAWYPAGTALGLVPAYFSYLVVFLGILGGIPQIIALGVSLLWASLLVD